MKYHHRFLCGALMLALLATPAFASDTATEGKNNVPAPEMGLDGKPIKGKVLETMNAAGYTYINLETSQGKIWVAVPQAKVEVGKEVTAMPGMVMANFESKTLGRTFETHCLFVRYRRRGRGLQSAPDGRGWSHDGWYRRR